MEIHSKQNPDISENKEDKMRQSSPLPSSVGYNDKKASPTSSPLKNYDNIDVKFNVVPAGPQPLKES